MVDSSGESSRRGRLKYAVEVPVTDLRFGVLGLAMPSPAKKARICAGTSRGWTADEVQQFLCGEWWSREMGYILVYVIPHLGSSNIRRYEVSRPDATTSSCVRQCLAHFDDDGLCEHIELDVDGVDNRQRLSQEHSKRSLALWTSDCWDKRLLHAIRQAASWVETHQFKQPLQSDMVLGLQSLASGKRTASDRTVALCTSTKARLWQLRRALPLNLLHAWPHRDWVKIHLVVCDCGEGSIDWVLQHCRPAIEADLLRLYSTDGHMPHWHASVGKNTAHMVATEDILVNVDCDNLIGPDFPENVVEHFNNGAKVVQYEYLNGTTGRIACLREDFLFLRGYDEDVYPMGGQDTDLRERLKMRHGEQAYRNVRILAHGQAIPNDTKAKVSCCSPMYGNLRWGRMDHINRVIFKHRRNAGQVRRNLGSDQIGVPAFRVHAKGYANW